MKKLLLTIVLVLAGVLAMAQTEVSFDFNDYGEQQNLDGQHGWAVRTHHGNNNGLPLYTDYLGPRDMTSADETIAVFSKTSCTNCGDIATKSLTEYGFDFSTGGVIEIECDMWREWWGDFFGIGYDGDGDGFVLPPTQGNNEPTLPDPTSTATDGGIYMLTTGVNPTNANFKNGVVLPNNTFANTFAFEPHQQWYRWKVSIDLDANNGAGAVTLFKMDDPNSGEYEPVPEIQGVNAGLTPGSGNKYDPAMWNKIFLFNSGYGGFDNFTIRHMPGGLAAQFINFAAISDQLVYAAPITLQATSTSGLPVTFEVIQGPATVEGNILTLTGEEGTVKIRAMQPGDGTTWQSAPAVTRLFYVVDPENYTPEITIRRPYEGTKVYMPDFENPVLLVLSAYIEHGNVLKFEEVKCTVDGQELILKTDYPDDPTNGYWHTTWIPSGEGTYNMTASITQTGGKVTTASNTFEVSTTYDDMTVSALNGELVVSKTVFTSYGEFPFPTHVNAFNAINLHYLHDCVNNSCPPYDHVSRCRVKNYRGEWVELCRYTTPFGVECVDDLDVSDFTTLLQGLVEFELHCEMWDNTGQGYSPTAIFEYTKGTPDYPYVDLNEIWFGTYDFGDYKNPCPVPGRHIEFDPCVEKAKLNLVTSGHHWSSGTNGNYNTGNAAEFYDATHNIKINGALFDTQHLWQACSPNPAGCQPQNGTWTYARAGWCPGSFAMVWNYSLDNYLSSGIEELLYEFDPDYIDECHPNYPDCVNGQNSCPNCQDADNPILIVSGKLVTYSHNSEVAVTEVTERPDTDAEPFHVTLSPNPVEDYLTITTDYDKGRTGVHILNAQGMKVRGFNMQGTVTIDMSDLPAGVYFVQILGGQMVTKKIIKE